jgi:hypothetical protein
MLNAHLERAFEKMGARVKFNGVWGSQFQRGRIPVTLNVLRDKAGEFFLISKMDEVELQVLDVQQKDRHLLLMSREKAERQHLPDIKRRFLLGHDERHWFVAAIPEETPVSSVRDAKQALKPSEVLTAEVGLATSKRNRRHNEAWKRQGEWFFVPDSSFCPPEDWRHCILKNEPITRGRSKPHICEELYRSGGETVYVAHNYRSGLTEGQYEGLDKKERESRNWQVMKRNMDVWVRGKVRHPDHATLTLNGWHRVRSNTEHLSQAMRNVVFLD